MEIREQRITLCNYHHCFVSVIIFLIQMLHHDTVVFVLRKKLPSFPQSNDVMLLSKSQHAGELTSFIDSVDLHFFLKEGWMTFLCDYMLFFGNTLMINPH